MIALSPFQWSSLNFFGYYTAYGVLLPFLPVWLNHHGYDTEMIGTLISLGYLFRFAGAIYFSRTHNPNQLINLNRFLTWAALLATGLMAWTVGEIWLFLPAFALFQLFNGGAMPIGETIASTWQQQVGLDYGKTRLFGSLAFVLGLTSTGYLIGVWGESAIIGILGGWLALQGLGISARPTQNFSQNAPLAEQDKQATQSYWQLFKQPTTMRMLLAVSLIQGSHATYYAYSAIYWTSHGIATQTASWLWGTAVVAEIALFFLANKLFKTWKTYHLMLFAALGAMLRWALIASSLEVSAIALAQTLHAVSYAVGHCAMIRYISTQPVQHIAKLQALYFSLASCIVIALFTFISGLIYPHSPTFSFWLMLLLAAPALLIAPRQVGSRLV